MAGRKEGRFSRSRKVALRGRSTKKEKTPKKERGEDCMCAANWPNGKEERKGEPCDSAAKGNVYLCRDERKPLSP